MTVGFVMLAHEALHRAAEVALTIAKHGCPLVVHVDKRTPDAEFEAFLGMISGEPRISLADRLRCDWGTWSLVEASRRSAEQLLTERPEIGHVMLISGSCLPIKPLPQLKAFLRARPDTDFIESVTVDEVPWTQGGLSEERFHLSFPFPWKRHRGLFDIWVEMQRRSGRVRAMPEGLQPHLGSQWWCLSRGTLERILSDPRRAKMDRYFRRVWIPDESYFQTMTRMHGARVESRSLTLSKFDFMGKPHLFYDDHLKLLSESPAFFARKIWPGARRLYRTFLSDGQVAQPVTASGSGSFADRLFGEAVAQRTSGRAGLTMAGRFPREGFENGLTAGPYAVFYGFDDVFEGFADWLRGHTGSRVHGRLFHPNLCRFEENERVWVGALSDSAALRDYDPDAFLRNLVWNTRGEHQSFQMTARDRLDIGDFLSRDRNATIHVVTGAWVVPLLISGQTTDSVRATAARQQRAEAAFVARLRERRSLAESHIWSLADVIERPGEPLQRILDGMTGADPRALAQLPAFRRLDGLPEALQALRNSGMNPCLAGDIARVPDRDDATEAGNVVRLR